MKKVIHCAAVIVLDLWIEIRYRLTFALHRLDAKSETDIVIAMTSYPARIKHAWLALESLFRQDTKGYRVVLVLAESQFPARRLPRMIRRLEKKGLGIIWTSRDGKSFDHLWPAYGRFPHCSVISVDDDKFFSESLVSTLRREAQSHPQKIIGWRGWEMRPTGKTVEFGVKWVRATPRTPSKKLFIPPGNGSLYPPGSLPAMTADHDVRERICPNADDVWYWAMARLNGSESLCLGLPNHRVVWRQSHTTAISEIGPGPTEFANVVRHFKMLPSLHQDLDGA